ncbi:hypothetical protein OIV83_002332 [Microbotryomycetes sp. JL201]|nr:hypothetical protein OIV83_002332 [Microbotryomycetes sp. JL201]
MGTADAIAPDRELSAEEVDAFVTYINSPQCALVGHDPGAATADKFAIVTSNRLDVRVLRFAQVAARSDDGRARNEGIRGSHRPRDPPEPQQLCLARSPTHVGEPPTMRGPSRPE